MQKNVRDFCKDIAIAFLSSSYVHSIDGTLFCTTFWYFSFEIDKTILIVNKYPILNNFPAIVGKISQLVAFRVRLVVPNVPKH